MDQALVVAALESFPPAYARFVDADVAPEGQEALALILLNPEREPYPMVVWLDWSEGEGWTQLQVTEADERVVNKSWTGKGYYVCAAGRADVGAQSVTLVAHDIQRRRNVTAGWYIVALWSREAVGPTRLFFEP